MPVNQSDCPNDPEDVAERYCMDTLPQADREVFERHVQGCRPCASVLRDTQAYVEAMRDAAQEIRKREKSN
jgi:putative zinc finger protein